MRLCPVLYMETEISPKTVSFHPVLLWCNIAIKGECSAPLWSFNFVSKLM